MTRPQSNIFEQQEASIVKALAEPQYREYWPLLRSFMSRSRSLRDQPMELFQLQVEMAGGLRGAQESQKLLKAQLADVSDADTNSINDIQKLIAASRRLAYVIKSIADGIAWRTLGYDRTLIQLLSMKPQTGHLDLDKTPQELEAAGRHVERTGNPVVINDLTSVLRHGDVTTVKADGTVGVAEVKSGKGSAKSGRATRQKRNLRQAMQFYNAGVGRTGEGSSARFLHRVGLKTHLVAVSQVLREARAQGSAHARLSDCLAVDAWYMGGLFQEDKCPKHTLHNPFSQSSQASSSNSLRYFDQMATPLAPYSIFPFPDDDCLDLMTGAMWLVLHFNHGRFIRVFQRSGLEARWPTDESLAGYVQLDRGAKKLRRDDVAIRVSRPGGLHCLLIGGGDLGRVLYEFLT